MCVLAERFSYLSITFIREVVEAGLKQVEAVGKQVEASLVEAG